MADADKPAVVSLLVDLPSELANVVASVEAIEHAARSEGADVAVRLVRTNSIDGDFIDDPGDGVFVGPGTPYREPSLAESVIFSARERGVPLVGT